MQTSPFEWVQTYAAGRIARGEWPWSAGDMSSSELQLISHPLCPYVHRAAAMLTEKGVPFTQTFVDLKAKPDWFLAISPRGTVPVLVTKGVAIFESVVIVQYLDEICGPHMLPEDPLERARQRMWVEISNDLMTGHYKIATAATPDERTQAIATARDTLQRFEQVIAGPLFAGETLGIVDVAAGPALVRFERMDAILGLDSYAGLPKVAAWSHAIVGRPAFRDTLAPDFDVRYRAMIKRHDAAA